MSETTSSMLRLRGSAVERRLRVGEMRTMHAAVAHEAHAVRSEAGSRAGAGIRRGVRGTPEALQLPWGWHHGAHGVEADSHGDHLALLRVGLAAEEERETKAVVTR